MSIKKEDLEILKDIELYLYNKNLNKMVVFDKNFAIKKEDIGDIQAFELYVKLYHLIEKLEIGRKNNIQKVNNKNKTIYRERHKLNNKISYLRNKKNQTEEDKKLYEELLLKREILNSKIKEVE